ncbi:hypothetical protein ACQKC5_08295, partial [Shewanella baltica]|uniref:hypothetical protein n=1 Tax=Shewanella baltica TaxID=62322 RepID=UPI003CFEB7EA
VAGSSPVRSANISISPNSNVRAFSYLEFIYFNRRGTASLLNSLARHPCLSFMSSSLRDISPANIKMKASAAM